MANKCYNELRFTGDMECVKKANLFLAGLKIDEWDGAQIPETAGYFQDIYFSNGSFQFGTRWLPDIQTTRIIADRFGVGFVLNYNDPQMSLYGQSLYHQGRFWDTRLEAEDFKKISYDKKEEIYEYKGRHFRSIEKPALQLLKDKIAQELQHARKKRLKL